MAKKEKPVIAPWTFRGEPFTQDNVAKEAGFVYLITDLVNGKMYVGKKNFSGKRKLKGAKRRSTVLSDWEKYFGSNKEIKELVKSDGPQRFKREILSIHDLQRDVNFCEIREQWKRDVLEAVDENGERIYYNENINGKHFPYLVIGWQDRSKIA